MAALEKENKDLRAELEAFDLEFFEGAWRPRAAFFYRPLCARPRHGKRFTFPNTHSHTHTHSPRVRRNRGPQVPLRGGREKVQGL
jgi:hypothetical protein